MLSPGWESYLYLVSTQKILWLLQHPEKVVNTYTSAHVVLHTLPKSLKFLVMSLHLFYVTNVTWTQDHYQLLGALDNYLHQKKLNSSFYILLDTFKYFFLSFYISWADYVFGFNPKSMGSVSIYIHLDIDGYGLTN